jgi:hypothetical protein
LRQDRLISGQKWPKRVIFDFFDHFNGKKRSPVVRQIEATPIAF